MTIDELRNAFDYILKNSTLFSGISYIMLKIECREKHENKMAEYLQYSIVNRQYSISN